MSKGSQGATLTAHLSDDLTHILHHHLVCCYRLHSEQAPLVNATRTETGHFLAKLVFRDSGRSNRLLLLILFVIGIPNDTFSCNTEEKHENRDWKKKNKAVNCHKVRSHKTCLF